MQYVPVAMFLALTGFAAPAAQSLHADGKVHDGVSKAAWVLLHTAFWTATFALATTSPVLAVGSAIAGYALNVLVRELHQGRAAMVLLWVAVDLCLVGDLLRPEVAVFALATAGTLVQLASVCTPDPPVGVAASAWICVTGPLGVLAFGYTGMPSWLGVLPALVAVAVAGVVAVRVTLQPWLRASYR